MLAECVLDCGASFGECPIWHEVEQALYWIDVGAPSVNRFDPTTGKNQSWAMPEPIGALALANDGRLLVALKSGLNLFAPQTGALELVADPEPERPDNRLNDGRCDRRGRFWVGSMRDPVVTGLRPGALYSIDGRQTRQWGDGLGISNGIAFSPDDKTFYHSDSLPEVSTIWAYDFDIDDGIITNRRVFVETEDMSGRPDGATIDTDGCYWSASNDGWAVIRYTPRGVIDKIIRVPVRWPSMPCFGGPDLNTLFITSLRRIGLDLCDQPQAGGLFAVELPFQGIAEPRFRVPALKAFP